MTMVSASAFYNRTSQSLASLRAQAERLQAALGSGQRLGPGSDDPVAAAQLRSLARAESFAKIDTTAASRAASDLTLTDSALSAFSDTVIRAKELATQAANGVINANQRAGIATELGQLHGELIRLANTRDSAGHALFGGDTTGPAYVLDASGNPVYAGTAAAGEIALGDGQSVTRSVTGPEVLNFAGTDMFAVLKGLADALNGAAPDPAQAARDALGPLDNGLDTITTAQTVVGARLNWIDLTTERRTQMSEQNADQQAALGGTDIAETVNRLQQTMTVLEASQASFVKLASLSLFDLLR